MRVHSVLPEHLAAAVEAGRGALEHVAHPAAQPMRAAEAAAADPDVSGARQAPHAASSVPPPT